MSPRQYDGEVHLTDVLGAGYRPTARSLHEGERLLALAAEEDDVPAPWPNLAELVDLAALDTTVLEAADRGDQTELAHLLVDLDDVRLRVALALQVLEDALIPTMVHKTLEVEGLPVLEARGGSIRKAWQSDDLLSEVVRRSKDGFVSALGEIDPAALDLLAVVLSAVKAAAPFTASMGWRVTALRAQGIDPEDYCESSPGRRTVQIHRATQPVVTS